MPVIDADCHVIEPEQTWEYFDAADVAMARSYNRWMADVWKKGGGRLRWIAVPGVMDMECALDQVRWCVDHGACGVMLRGFERDRLVSDPYFFPLYELVQELDVP